MPETMKEALSAIQTRLAALGYYRLRVDGVAGPGTSQAIIDFKANHGLRARDFIGPLTLMRLFSPDAKPAPKLISSNGDPLWVSEARRRLGIRETPGSGNTPSIMEWARDLDQWYPGDDVPWCGLFVASCMSAGAPDEPQDFNRLGARNWIEYGEVAAEKGERPPHGAVCVLWRTHPTKSWHGHVFIVTGFDPTTGAVRGIGGNQSDAVTETWFSGDRVLGYRQPQGAKLLPAIAAHRGTLSTNEA